MIVVRYSELRTVSNYRDQVEYVKSIILAEGDRHTSDCPFCGGKNKFTLDKFDGKLIWNCYRASCGVKGAYTGKRDINAAKSYLEGNATQRFKAKYKEIPPLTTRVTNHLPAVSYLKHVNSYDAYIRGDIKIRYAPKEDRVLFYNSEGTGAVGRSLKPVRSKWWSYGDLSKGIHVGIGTHAVLVEDVASACSVSNVTSYTGVALLGTNITKSITKTLNKYQQVTLVLDNDASLKAISIARKLNMECNVRLTRSDLKYLRPDQIKDLII
jgi:hypothetical protein|tara:strand:- start:1156 stop:1959 length:804 start_codon:yes stop_codon:yes gene_type:complete